MKAAIPSLAGSAMVAILYCQLNGAYSRLSGVDLWHEARDARLYSGPAPVVAHPPCRGWGRYRHLAKVKLGELDLAFHALDMVRRFGGVLEHPVGSTFFQAAGISRSELVRVNQSDWGHRALKPTFLYISGAVSLPPFPPPRPGVVPVERMWRGEREATPPLFASWLVQLASTCGGSVAHH